MQEKSLLAIHEFTRAVTQLVVNKDGIEGTPTPDIEAVLLALPPVWVVIEENPDWPQIMPLRRAVTATEALLTTLTVIEEEHNQAIVIEWALAWGGWLQSRLDAAKRYIDDQQPPPDVSNN